MAISLLYGYTAGELLATMRKLQDEWLLASRSTAAGAGDVNATMQLQDLKERIWQIQATLYQLDSTTYADFASVGQDRTKVAFPN